MFIPVGRKTLRDAEIQTRAAVEIAVLAARSDDATSGKMENVWLQSSSSDKLDNVWHYSPPSSEQELQAKISVRCVFPYVYAFAALPEKSVQPP